MKKTAFYYPLVIALLFILNSCSKSDNDSDNDSITNNSPYSKFIIGKWTWDTPYSPCSAYIEFKSDGTITQIDYRCYNNELITNGKYTLSGNKLTIKYDVYEGTDEKTIISTTDNTMKISYSAGSALGTQYRTFYRFPY